LIILKEGDKGTKVQRLQSLLGQLGYYKNGVDGIFGAKTKQALMRFQGNNGLLPTGIVDDRTDRVLESFYKGFFNYVVRKGDTLNDIAKKFKTTVNRLVLINKLKNPDLIYIGQELIIPYSNLEVVPTNIEYDYEVMEKNIKSLKVLYPFIEVGTIGQSILGKNLYYIKLGKGENVVGYNASHHALEWITSVLLMKFIENFSKAYFEGNNIGKYSPKQIWNESSIYIIPMVNPDGIDLVINGLKKGNPYYDDLINWNKGNLDFSKDWSANIRGVDLNHNYNASFEESKAAEEIYGVYGPGPTRYGGPYPESEPESRALANFTREKDFRLVLAYHSQGEVIYWQYKDMATKEAKSIGEVLANVSGYELGETTGITSYAGYKDWFIKEYLRPGYTVEVGKGKNPLPISQFDKIYMDNTPLLLEAAII